MELQQLDATACLPQAAAHELVGLDGFLARAEADRDQNDHDLDLITRRLQLSSLELSHTNDRLRLELDRRTRAVDSLRDTANSVLRTEVAWMPPLQADRFERASKRIPLRQ